MKKITLLFFLILSFSVFGQTDYSASWEDFYSYNNVKDFVKVDAVIYALADNAVFTYNTNSQEIQKFSSIQGLSGETTSSIYYSAAFQRLVIGYQNGLIEVVDNDGSITISSDIVSFNQNGAKSINHISEFNNKLYLSTPFAIVEYDIENLEFGDTFFIGNNSSDVHINETIIFNETIYAATDDGIFSADTNNDLLIDFNFWQQSFIGNRFQAISTFNSKIYTISNTVLFLVNAQNLVSQTNFFQSIKGLKSSASHLSVALNNSVRVFDLNMNLVSMIAPTSDFDFTLNTSFALGNDIYLGTKEFGVLKTSFTVPSDFLEIHPEGPLSNEVFSIDANNDHLWIVYGGYNTTYTPIQKKQGFSHFNGEAWVNTPYNSNLPRDLADVTIDPNNENKVYISALGVSSDINVTPTGGLFVVENDVVTQTYNHLNSSFEPIAVSLPNINIRVSSAAFDASGNLWTTNYQTAEELKKLSANGQWSSIDLSSIKTSDAPGLNEVVIDRSNSIWIGTRRNGVYIYNESGNRKIALNTGVDSGNLPDLNVRTIAVDRNNRAWLGTKSGLVVFNNAANVFDVDSADEAATPVIILDDGVAKKLLGDQTINTIAIDGAENKWFGTDSGGVLYTNPNGQMTLANFNKNNSPLPSNTILKIKVDKNNGKVYFATDKGIVAYNSNVAPFGVSLGAVYAYPNPALTNHETVTIDGRNGTHLPKGTNVKIIDVAGNLVYETNVVEGEQLQGGKVVWNKKNLAGNTVVSGIYIVLLSNDDASETSITKIAIVN
tara:strand:+ start:616 stop:2943 length:2328 start_codon:yes stop_codon:yes gene_type:complete